MTGHCTTASWYKHEAEDKPKQCKLNLECLLKSSQSFTFKLRLWTGQRTGILNLRTQNYNELEKNCKLELFSSKTWIYMKKLLKEF